MRPPAPQLAAQPSAGATPGLPLLWRAAGRCWLALAALGTLAGLVWRLTGAAPDLALALDGAGLALWLCAWELAPALDHVRERQQRHNLSALARGRYLSVTTLHLWGVAVCLALAPAGLLLGYDGRAILIELQTLDPLTFNLTAAFVGGAVLALAGPAALVTSTLLLAILRRFLGNWPGILTWFALALLVHLPMLAGPSSALANGAALRPGALGIPGEMALPTGIPLGLGLGQYAHAVLRFIQQNTLEAGHYAYLEDLLRRILAWPGLGLLAALLLWCGLSTLPQHPRRLRWHPAWPATFSLLAAGLMQLARTAQWEAQPELRFPTQLLTVFTTGLAVLWLSHALGLLAESRQPRPGLASAGWAVLAAAGWLALTLPQVAAGQASPGSVLILAGAAALTCLAGQGLLSRLAWLQPSHGGWFALVGALILVLPALPSGSLVARMLTLLHAAGLAPTTLQPQAIVAICAVIAALACWPWPARRRVDHTAARIR